MALEKIVDHEYRAATLGRIEDCLVVGEPIELAPKRFIWKLMVRQPDGAEIQAYYSLVGTGRKSIPQAQVTRCALDEVEHVVTNRETGQRVVKGSLFWVRPYWSWMIVPTIVPTNEMNYPLSTDGEAAPANLLQEHLHSLNRVAPAFVERAVISGVGGTLDDIKRIPIGYVLNTHTDQTYAVHIAEVSVEEIFRVEYTFTAKQVDRIEQGVMAPYNIDLIERTLGKRFSG